MSAESIGWHDEHDLDNRRRVRNAMYISFAVHACFFAALVISPPVSFAPLPQTISVELIAGPQIAPPAGPRPSGHTKPPPPPPAPEPPPEAAAPEAPPEPAPPPPPKAPVAVLPENAPKPDQKVKQAPEKKPKEAAKPESKPAEKPVKKPDKSLSYDDAMKSLDDELGEDETKDLLEAAPQRPAQRQAAQSSGAAESSAGVQLSPEDAAWVLATRRLIQSRWVMQAGFRNRGLATVMELRLSASGEVVGEPKVTRTSGDPYFDDNAVRAVLKSSPLPPPPRAGTTAFIFSSEEN